MAVTKPRSSARRQEVTPPPLPRLAPAPPRAEPSPPAPSEPAASRFPALAELIGYLEGLNGRADLAVLSRLLAKVRATRADLAPACVFGERGYRRNTIARSAWFELLAVCWRSGQCTPIHDHRGNSCAFRVVEGVGTEIRFKVTPSGLVCPSGTTAMDPGYICSAEDADIHQVANMQEPGRDLVTLHIYSPPITKMQTYKFAVSDGAECASEGCEPAI